MYIIFNTDNYFMLNLNPLTPAFWKSNFPNAPLQYIKLRSIFPCSWNMVTSINVTHSLWQWVFTEHFLLAKHYVRRRWSHSDEQDRCAACHPERVGEMRQQAQQIKEKSLWLQLVPPRRSNREGKEGAWRRPGPHLQTGSGKASHQSTWL